jgi:hypothetical protein
MDKPDRDEELAGEIAECQSAAVKLTAIAVFIFGWKK